jgi:hypothetical protein
MVTVVLCGAGITYFDFSRFSLHAPTRGSGGSVADGT